MSLCPCCGRSQGFGPYRPACHFPLCAVRHMFRDLWVNLLSTGRIPIARAAPLSLFVREGAPFMAHEVLKWFNQASDCGFIACDDGGPDRYVRGENVSRGASIGVSARVRFEPREGGMGPEATNVRARSATRHPRNGRIEPSRRHGPFDPRFSPRRNAARLLATSNDPAIGSRDGRHAFRRGRGVERGARKAALRLP